MKAIVHHGPKGLDGVKYTDMKEPEPKAGEVKVRLKMAGLNHRDLLVPNRRNEDDPAVILGSDGAGVIEELGEGVTDVLVGDEVMINPGLRWREKSDAPPKEFEILGFPSHGTFAESVVVPAENVVKKPAQFSWEEAAVLPLSALTAYRALFTRAKVKKGDTVFIPGIGSGVATYMLQFARAAGARVIVTSRNDVKLEKAAKLGADVVVHTNSDWNQELANEKVDIVIESVGAATFNRSLKVLRPGGTIVTFGASAGDMIQINIREFFYGQYNLFGSTMGSQEEFEEMVKFVQNHNIKPVLDKVFPLSEALEAFHYMDEAEQFGKIAFKIKE
ncbi:MAG: zinc-binding dehydrogenase [Bacillaceae bacterium]|nr:zinc-binding dehydrogenase [Bacillaceae bacterium]